jgi:hypothetical protein
MELMLSCFRASGTGVERQEAYYFRKTKANDQNNIDKLAISAKMD